MFGRIVSRNVALGLGAGFLLSLPPAQARATDSLSTPITGEEVRELWPLEVGLQIVPVSEEEEEPIAEIPVPTRSVVVPDGSAVHFTSVVETSSGTRQFDLEVTARHHPGDAVELEWDLSVLDSRYRPVSWSGYLLHRLRLGPDLELQDPRLKIARSDIVSTTGEPFAQIVDIDGETYEIRIFAQTTRG